VQLKIDKQLLPELRLRNVKQNFNGNGGVMFYGFIDDGRVFSSEWSGQDGSDFVYKDFDWQADANGYCIEVEGKEVGCSEGFAVEID
jgi:hypothetical protein